MIALKPPSTFHEHEEFISALPTALPITVMHGHISCMIIYNNKYCIFMEKSVEWTTATRNMGESPKQYFEQKKSDTNVYIRPRFH